MIKLKQVSIVLALVWAGYVTYNLNLRPISPLLISNSHADTQYKSGVLSQYGCEDVEWPYQGDGNKGPAGATSSSGGYPLTEYVYTSWVECSPGYFLQGVRLGVSGGYTYLQGKCCKVMR